MTTFPPETRLGVYPFTRQPDGDEVIIGRPDTATFLALPPDALQLLDDLASGQTIGEAQAAYQARWGETPDLDSFLGLLARKGFIWPATQGGPVEEPERAAKPIRYHLTGISEATARRFFGPTAFVIYGVTIALALMAAALEPWLLPGRNAIFFERDMTLLIILVTVLSLSGIFIHEVAHLVAARAVGVPARLGISNRLWVIVAETDMTGVWQVPRHKRYLPILAGPLIDAFSASVITLFLFADSQGWLTLAPLVYRCLQALWFGYAFSIIWQCAFFVRTDFYYVIVNYFGCRDLMRNTEAYLRNLAARFLPRLGKTDLSDVPPREMAVVRWYALVWLGGRVLAFYVAFALFLPVTVAYLQNISRIFSQGYGADPSAYIDVVLFGALFLVHQGLGLGLWLRSLLRRKVASA